MRVLKEFKLLGDWCKPITPFKFLDVLAPWPEPKYSSAFECSGSYLRFLKKKGFRVIGSGFYSSVLCKGNSNKVIKVGRPDNWIDYILWSSKNGYMGGLAPKVFSYKYHKGKGERSNPFYVAVMEKLDSTLTGTYKDPYVTVPILFDYSLADNDNAQKCMNLIYPGAGDFAKKLKEAFPKYRFDIHRYNFMTRGKELVLIDPLTDQGVKYTTRIKDFSKAA